MGNIGFNEDVSKGFIAKRLVEGNYLCLGVQEKRGGALPLGFEGYLLHDIFAIAKSALNGQQAANYALPGFFTAEEARVGNDVALAMQGDMCALVIDIVHVEVMAFLLGIEDNEAGFEDFV